MEPAKYTIMRLITLIISETNEYDTFRISKANVSELLDNIEEIFLVVVKVSVNVTTLSQQLPVC